MENKRVEEIMVPLDKYPHVQESASLKEAMKAMLECQLEVRGQKSLPRIVLVFSAQNELTGWVRRRDIMRGLEPEFLVKQPIQHRKSLFEVPIDNNLPEVFFRQVVTGLTERAKHKVSEFMMPVDKTVNWDDHILKVIYEMVDHNLSLLPVMRNGRVIGVVRSVEVFRELADLLFQPGELDGNCD